MTTASTSFPTAEQQQSEQNLDRDGLKAGDAIANAFDLCSYYGSPKAAITKLQEALEIKSLNKNDKHGQIMLLTALTDLSLKAEFFDNAKRYIEQAYGLNDKDPRTLRSYAVVLCAHAYYGRAREIIDQAVALDPQNRHGLEILNSFKAFPEERDGKMHIRHP